MTKETTLHVKIKSQTAKDLKNLAKLRQLTVGELVRRALIACYQVDMQGLSMDQRQALEAYRGGYISLGKLSEVMGQSVLDMRCWLNEQGIEQNTCLGEDDARYA